MLGLPARAGAPALAETGGRAVAQLLPPCCEDGYCQSWFWLQWWWWQGTEIYYRGVFCAWYDMICHSLILFLEPKLILTSWESHLENQTAQALPTISTSCLQTKCVFFSFIYILKKTREGNISLKWRSGFPARTKKPKTRLLSLFLARLSISR